MTWNFDISSAPKDRYIWTASLDFKVIKTRWSKDRKAFEGYKTGGSLPLAWCDYIVPVHPFLMGAAQ